uniref:phosphatidylserine decarboxylase n=1 Tax=Phallusia mammillata TaxID=59560 RepID=A0A6F9DPH7_9ASCI|nr:phosphatidylserine decarboxylase proenzyme-like [Phallusia mammillata]
MRVFFALFTYFLPVDIRPAKWLHDLSAPSHAENTKSRKEKQRSQKSEFTQCIKKKHLRSILHLWDTNPNSNALATEIKLTKKCWPALWPRGAIMTSISGAAAFSLTSRSFTASDSYTWYCLLVVASFFMWIRLKKCTQNTLICIMDNFQIKFLQSMPYRIISRGFGQLGDINIWPFFRPHLYKFFVCIWKIDMKEAVDEDLENYRTVNDLFRRPIKRQLRPIHSTADVVSPVDGKVMQSGEASQGVVEQVKGMTYSLKNFLGPLKEQDGTDNLPLHKYARSLMHNPRKNSLFCCVIYLAPGNYHRFHSPAEWRMEHRRHFVGDLLSVNPRIACIMPGLLVINERVVLTGKWKYGFFSMTAVGATSVGSIVIYDDKALQTNKANVERGTYFDHKYENGGVLFSRGDSVGEFRLGSTVVLVFEAPKKFNLKLREGQSVKYGQAVSFPVQ